MSNVSNIPLENAYEVELENSMTSTQTTMVVSEAPAFTLPGGQGVYAVIDPKNSFREVVLITGIAGTTLTVTRGQSDYDGGASTATTHSGGAIIIITNSYHIFDEYADAINSKLDQDGGNTTTTFDLDLSGSDFRIRLDGSDMKFTDDNQAEVTLSTLAAAAGVDDKFRISNADTTSEYADDKITVTSGTGATVTKSITSPAGNEKLNIDVALDITTAGVDAHDIYTPAYLTGGNSAEGTFSNWLAVLDGEFQITIDGATYNISGIDFTGVTDMASVADYLQIAIRAATSGSETCVWSTNHFVITSGDLTSSSAITVTSTVAAPAGTDISGAGAANWMDCDVGNGVVTNAVRNDAADAGKVILLDSSGYIDGGFMPDNLRDAAETGSTDITGTELESMSDGSDITDSLHEHSQYSVITNTGQGSRAAATASGTENIAHGLGRQPKQILFFAGTTTGGAGSGYFRSSGVTDSGLGNNATGAQDTGGGAVVGTQFAGLCMKMRQGAVEASQAASVTAWDATNFTLTWTKTGAGLFTHYTWIALA
jgi:hypothetical protein